MAWSTVELRLLNGEVITAAGLGLWKVSQITSCWCCRLPKLLCIWAGGTTLGMPLSSVSDGLFGHESEVIEKCNPDSVDFRTSSKPDRFVEEAWEDVTPN
jgi:hypothetical protein